MFAFSQLITLLFTLVDVVVSALHIDATRNA